MDSRRRPLREEFESDLLLIDALHNLLPLYRGRELRLYRGEFQAKRKRRTYGFSWTEDIAIARDYADNKSIHAPAVLLETVAPRAAIVCVPHNHILAPHAVEAEVIVDRRKLGTVRVLERFPKKDRPSRLKFRDVSV
jgi:hypothetical protein